ALAAVDDPLQHPHVLAEAGPEEVAVVALAKPVDVEDARAVGHPLAHAEPVDEVVADVVADEREHGHRVAADDADLSGGGGGGLRAYGCADVDAVRPVERLEHEGNDLAAPPAED